MSAACFVHDSTYMLKRQTCLTVQVLWGAEVVGSSNLRDLITPFFTELVVEEEYFVLRLVWVCFL